MKLYTCESFNPKKVERALFELGLDFEPIEVDLYSRQNRDPAFLSVNPRGKIPVLVDGDVVLSESYAIVAYLGDREGRLWPTDAAGRATALQWLFYAANHLEDDVGHAWFQAWTMPRLGRPSDTARVEAAHKALSKSLRHLEDTLAQRPWLLDELTLVDLAIAVLLAALGGSGFDWTPFPAITDWRARIAARPTWARLALKYA